VAEERFDAIVVGAGPGGSSAAYTLAKAGLSVALLERGTQPGSKNVSGQVLYRQMLDDVEAGLSERAPVERHLIEENLWLLTADAAVTLGHRSYGEFDSPPYNAFTVLRAKFDAWFAAQAEAKGAVLATETQVEELVQDDHGRVVGVRTGEGAEDVLHADVVVVADGVYGLLGQRLGLHPKPRREVMAMAAKEIVALPRETIEARFRLGPGQGCTIEMLGESTAGLPGMAWCYTNLDSLSIGVGVILSELNRALVKPNDLLERLKAHPAVAALLQGGQTKEYQAHLIPEGGYDEVPELCCDGALWAGDAAMLSNAVHREGANLAMTSGRLAAETIVELKQAGQPYDREHLGAYRSKLDQSYVLQDLKKYRRAPEFIRTQSQFFTTYPQLANLAAEEMLRVDGVPKKVKQRRILKEAVQRRGRLAMLRDGWRLWRAMW
jgi:electron transfer flavoprotein-quinone oxidoreductase